MTPAFGRSAILVLCLGGAVSPVPAQSRAWREFAWAPAGGITPESDALLNPLRHVADSAAIYFMDPGDFSVKAFSWKGALLWKFGRRGQGPGEFSYPLGIARGAHDELVVYDHGTLRLTTLTRTGVLLRTTQVETLLQALLFLPDGRFLAQAPFRSPFIGVFDSLGRLIRNLPVPADMVGRLMPEVQLVAGQDGAGTYVWASMVTDRFYVVQAPDLAVREYRGLEAHPYPRMERATVQTPKGNERAIRPDPDTRYTNMAVGISRGSILLFQGDATRPAYQVVDVYGVADGRYAYSFKLPAACYNLVILRDAFLCYRPDPVPELRIWRRGLEGGGAQPHGNGPMSPEPE